MSTPFDRMQQDRENLSEFTKDAQDESILSEDRDRASGLAIASAIAYAADVILYCFQPIGFAASDPDEDD